MRISVSTKNLIQVFFAPSLIREHMVSASLPVAILTLKCPSADSNKDRFTRAEAIPPLESLVYSVLTPLYLSSCSVPKSSALRMILVHDCFLPRHTTIPGLFSLMNCWVLRKEAREGGRGWGLDKSGWMLALVVMQDSFASTIL